MHAIKKKFTKNQLTFLQLKNLKDKSSFGKTETEKRKQKPEKLKDPRGKNKKKRTMECFEPNNKRPKTQFQPPKKLSKIIKNKKLKTSTEHPKNKKQNNLERRVMDSEINELDGPRKRSRLNPEKRSKSLCIGRKEIGEQNSSRRTQKQLKNVSKISKKGGRKKSLIEGQFKEEKMMQFMDKLNKLNVKNLMDIQRKKSNLNVKNLKKNMLKFQIFKNDKKMNQNEKQKKKKESFLKIVTKKPKNPNHFTFSENEPKKANNVSTKSNNKNQTQTLDAISEEKQLLTQIENIKNAFKWFLKEHVETDLHFEYVCKEISEYFSENNPESWNLGFETVPIFYKIKQKIGTKVNRNRFLVSQVLTGQDFWIESVSKSRNLGQNVRKEVSILTALKGESFVVPFYEMFEDKKNFYLVFEKSSKTNFAQLLENELPNSELPREERLRRLALHLLESVEYVHSCGIVKRNICPENVYLNETDEARLFDFSNSSIVHQKSSINMKDMKSSFTAPELANEPSTSDPKSDVYSCGQILKLLHEKFNSRNEIIESLIEEMTRPDRTKRVSLRECFEHEFFRNCDDHLRLTDSPVAQSSNLVENSKHYNFHGATPGKIKFTNKLHSIESENKMNQNKIFGFKLANNKKQNQFKLLNNNLPKPSLNNSAKTPSKFETCNQKLVQDLIKSLIFEYLSACGFEMDYLKRMIFSGESEVFCHAGACYKILIKKFYLE